MAPIEIGLLLLGLVLGPFINFAIYAFAYFPRQISPWQSPTAGEPVRRNVTKLPIVGWCLRFGEIRLHGRWFWLRPMLIEVATPIALVGTYRFALAGGVVPSDGIGFVSTDTLMHHFYVCSLLITLMAIATFIDFDERTIPDLITVPGTLLALLGGVVFPDWRLHELSTPIPPALVGSPQPIQANSPFVWNMAWDSGAPGHTGLILGLVFWSGWCFGMADRRWISRRGWKKAVIYFYEVLRRSSSSRFLLGLWVFGMVSLIVAYWTVSPSRWEALLSSLFGMGLGGMLVWGFRLVARWALGQEALGFGDVTLMAMIGAFFGWQIVWISFFLAPFFGMLFVLIAYAITRDNATPFGPYLCAATLYSILDWNRVWSWTSLWFLPPSFVLIVLFVLLVALGVLLWMMHWVKMLLFSLGARGASR
jgi:leader peptidase (prepilin peptidase) / N-methyltransferase